MYGDLAPSSPAGVPTFGSVPHGVVQDDQKAAVTLDANLQVRRVRCSRGRSTDSAPSRLPVFAGAGASGVPCVAASGRIPVGRPARSRPTRFGISRCRSRTPGLRTKRARPGASSAWLCIRSDGTYPLHQAHLPARADPCLGTAWLLQAAGIVNEQSGAASSSVRSLARVVCQLFGASSR